MAILHPLPLAAARVSASFITKPVYWNSYGFGEMRHNPWRGWYFDHRGHVDIEASRHPEHITDNWAYFEDCIEGETIYSIQAHGRWRVGMSEPLFRKPQGAERIAALFLDAVTSVRPRGTRAREFEMAICEKLREAYPYPVSNIGWHADRVAIQAA